MQSYKLTSQGLYAYVHWRWNYKYALPVWWLCYACMIKLMCLYFFNIVIYPLCFLNFILWMKSSEFLTHCGLVMLYHDTELGWHWTNVGLSSVRSNEFTWGQFGKSCKAPITKIVLEITFVKFHSILLWANELRKHFHRVLFNGFLFR